MSEINWEQRRWDAVLATMKALVLANDAFMWSDENIARWSVEQADATIKAYKEKSDD